MKTLWILAAAATFAACHNRSDETGAAPEKSDTTAVKSGYDTTANTGAVKNDTSMKAPSDTSMKAPSDTSMKAPTSPTYDTTSTSVPPSGGYDTTSTTPRHRLRRPARRPTAP